MKLFTTTLLLTSATVVLGQEDPKFPVNNMVTLAEAKAKCGKDADVLCCKKATYTHNINVAHTGPWANVLESALGGGPGGDGLGLFGQCKEFSDNILPLGGIRANSDDSVTEKCADTIACCQGSLSSVGNIFYIAKPCVALGSLF